VELGITKQLKSLLGPLHIHIDVFKLGEASNFVKPARVNKPVQSHIRLNAMPAVQQDDILDRESDTYSPPDSSTKTLVFKGNLYALIAG
jgi:hypothetical protein